MFKKKLTVTLEERLINIDKSSDNSINVFTKTIDRLNLVNEDIEGLQHDADAELDKLRAEIAAKEELKRNSSIRLNKNANVISKIKEIVEIDEA